MKNLIEKRKKITSDWFKSLQDKIINQLSEIVRRIERIELYLINH